MDQTLLEVIRIWLQFFPIPETKLSSIVLETSNDREPPPSSSKFTVGGDEGVVQDAQEMWRYLQAGEWQ